MCGFALAIHRIRGRIYFLVFFFATLSALLILPLDLLSFPPGGLR